MDLRHLLERYRYLSRKGGSRHPCPPKDGRGGTIPREGVEGATGGGTCLPYASFVCQARGIEGGSVSNAWVQLHRWGVAMAMADMPCAAPLHEGGLNVVLSGLALLRSLHLVEDVRSEKGNPVWRCSLCQSTFRGSMRRARAHLLGIAGCGVQPCPRGDVLPGSSRTLLLADQRAREGARENHGVVNRYLPVGPGRSTKDNVDPTCRMGAEALRRGGLLLAYRLDRGNPAWTCAYCGECFRGSMKRARAHLLQMPGKGVQPCKRTRKELEAENRQKLEVAVQLDLEEDRTMQDAVQTRNRAVHSRIQHYPEERTHEDSEEPMGTSLEIAAVHQRRLRSGLDFLIQGGYITDHRVEKGNPAWRCCFCGGEFRGSMKRARAHMLGKPGEGIQPCLQQLVKMTPEQEQRLIEEERDRSMATKEGTGEETRYMVNGTQCNGTGQHFPQKDSKVGLEFLKTCNFITGYHVDRGNPVWVCCFCGEHFKGSMKRARAHILQKAGFGIQTCKRTLRNPTSEQLRDLMAQDHTLS